VVSVGQGFSEPWNIQALFLRDKFAFENSALQRKPRDVSRMMTARTSLRALKRPQTHTVINQRNKRIDQNVKSTNRYNHTPALQ
jgi:hypothetical protein